MTHARPIPARPAPPAAFTLVELLVAIGIIVLLLGMAMPAFRAITGGRSEQGATNQVAAMLNRARADAVGLQVPRGVAFYTDPTGQCRMAEVGAVAYPAWTTANVNTPYTVGSYVSYTPSGTTIPQFYVCTQTIQANKNIDLSSPSPATWTPFWHQFVDLGGSAAPATPNPLPVATDKYYTSDYYFAANALFYDQLPDTDPIALPLGVGAQVITDSSIPAGGTRSTDAYLHNGLILFDASGRLISQRFVVSHYGLLGAAVALTDSVGTALNIAINATTNPPMPAPVSGKSFPPPQPLQSSFGLVLFDRDAHDNQNFPPHDPTLDATGPGATYGTAGGATRTPADEELWLDANATPLLINRYNGTLIRGE